MPLNAKDWRAYALGLKLAADFGASIAIPAVLLVWFGKYLQIKYDFAPYGVIAGFVIAVLVSIPIVLKRARRYEREFRLL